MIKKYVIKFSYFLSFYISFIITYLNYDIVYSPDFDKYFNYFLFYTGEIESTSLEQGNFYYYFLYIFTLLIQALTGGLSNFDTLNISILFGNFILYYFGTLGLRKYLFFQGFNLNKIYLSLIVLNISPPSLILRMTFKPELLGFVSIVWGIYLIDLFKKKKEIEFLYYFLLISIFISTLKISIFVMYLIFMFFHFGIKNLGKFRQLKVKKVILLLAAIFLLHGENYFLNDKLIFDVQHDEKYNNSASFEFFTNYNSREINDNPHKDFHNNSFRAITLLDTFSDYFELYWNADHSKFNSHRKDFLVFEEKEPGKKTNTIPIIKFSKETRTLKYVGDVNSRYIAEDEGENILDEIRMRTSLNVTLFFYFLVIAISFFYKSLRLSLLSPIIGIAAVAFSSAGFFSTKNFDPTTGDSVKTFYYAFFLCLSLTCLLVIINTRLKGKGTVISVFLIFMFLFFLGFPSKYSEQMIDYKNYKNSIVFTCELNQIFIEYDNVLNFENCKDSLQKKDSIYKYNSVGLKANLQSIPFTNLVFAIYLCLNLYKIRNKLE